MLRNSGILQSLLRSKFERPTPDNACTTMQKDPKERPIFSNRHKKSQSGPYYSSSICNSLEPIQPAPVPVAHMGGFRSMARGYP